MRSLQLTLLLGILEATGQLPIAKVARQPGAGEVYRVVAHYYDGRGRDSVGTLYCGRTGARVEVVYRGALSGKPLTYPVDVSRPLGLAAALGRAGFDKMADQDKLPEYDSTDCWMVERAAGAFSRSVIFLPEQATGGYAAVRDAIRQHLPEGLKQVR